jgi:hypothetical protein
MGSKSKETTDYMGIEAYLLQYDYKNAQFVT